MMQLQFPDQMVMNMCLEKDNHSPLPPTSKQHFQSVWLKYNFQSVRDRISVYL